MAEIVMIPVNQIHPHPKNPRKNIGDVTELANSIKAKGVLQNLTVVPGHWMTQEEWLELSAQYKENPTEEVRTLMNNKWLETGYTAIIGHRRLAASKQAGLPEVPCVVVNLTDREQFDTMMVENVQRADLTVYEQAQGFQMMLDMGGTVESVAEQTGFSQTTVRNRLKLMKLDQGKLEQSMERGATLQDYMELDKIQNPDRRNKVLESIGTPNFNAEMKSALAAEEFEQKMAHWESLFSPFATKVDKLDYSKYATVVNYTKWYGTGNETYDTPEDMDTVRYYYHVDKGYGVYLLKEKLPDPSVDEKAQAKALAEEIFKRKEAEAEEITDMHHSLRNDFLMEFTAGKKCAAAIEKFALQVIVRADKTWNNVDWLMISDMLDIRMDDDHNRVDPIEYAEVIKQNPEYALLVTAYAYISTEGDQYWGTFWKDGIRTIIHKPNDKLDMIYQMLTQLGYEMSDEEIAMQKGTHELFDASSDENDSEEDENEMDYDDLDDADFVEEDED